MMIVKCSHCGKEIEKKPSRVNYNKSGLWFCDRVCAGQYQTAQKRMTVCAVCGRKFYAEPYRFSQTRQRAPSIACSHACKQKMLGRGSTTLHCEHCGKEFKRKNAEVKEHNFCCRACMGKWQSDNMTGPNSNSWRGGYKDYYGPEWEAQRNKAYKRDCGICQCCRLHESDFGRALEVHHIKPFRLHTSSQQANQLSNLITLCPDCHRHADVIARRLFDECWNYAQLAETFQNHSAILRLYLDHTRLPAELMTSDSGSA